MRRRSSRSSVLCGLVAVAILMSLTMVGGAIAKPKPSDTAVIPLNSQIMSAVGLDAYEADNSTATAKPAPAVSRHTFNDELGDYHDFMYFTADMAGQPFMFETQNPNDGYYDTIIYIRDAAGTQLDYNDDSGIWDATYSTTIYWTAPAAGTYYIDVYNNSGGTYSYDLYYTKGIARRISGSNRYTNAIAISTLQWDDTGNSDYGTGYGPEDIFVANGANFADASAAAALATQAEGVVLLTDGSSLTPATKAELARLSESNYWDDTDVKVWVLGGTSSIKTSVMNEIKAMRNISYVERISGATRFDVASRVASITVNNDTQGTSVNFNNLAFVCNGDAWADQLSVAPVAAWGMGVVLFTNKDSVPAATLNFIDDAGVTDIVVVGGSSSVGAGALAQLKTAVGAANVTVLDGANRYATARKIAQWGVDEYGMYGNVCTLASGEVFPDALAAAPMSWWTEGPLLLTRGDVLSSEVPAFFDHNGGIDPGCYVVGGTNTITASTMSTFNKLYKDYLP